MRIPSSSGRLIINADDWGHDSEATQIILDCFLHRTISSVSAMVFMQDSERAAELAKEHRVDAGLHLNLTAAFRNDVDTKLQGHQEKVSAYLLRSSLSQAIFHPALRDSFEYVVRAQIDEFTRLYGHAPTRIDGHHHMHISANVLFAGLIPAGTTVRRSFTFRIGEKSFPNVIYRKALNRILARRYHLADYFFSLPELMKHNRVEEALTLAKDYVVEIETHPVNADEFEFLTGATSLHSSSVSRSYLEGGDTRQECEIQSN